MEANSFHDLKGSISLRAQETGSGFRFFFDDDEGSYFDLNLENMADSEDSEFQISFSPLPAAAAAGLSAQQQAADELFRNGRVLPLQVTSEARSSQLVPMYVDQLQVYPAEMLPLPERTAPADEGAAGGVKPKGQLHPGSEKARGAPDSSPQCMGKKKQQQQPQPQLAGTKKTSKVTAKKSNNGVAKFLIKFPSEMIRSTLLSIMKSYHLLSLQPKRGHGDGGLTQERDGRTKYKALLMHFSRWLTTRKKSSSHVVGKNGSAAAAAPSQRPSDVELDEVVVRSILEAVDFTVGSRSRGAAAGGGGSRPSQASSSSPRGIGRKGVAGAVERHSSISSAIAHCKMSYGNSTAPGFS